MNKTGFLEIFSDVISNANANGELKGNPDKAIDLGIQASNKYFELHKNSTRTYDDLFQLGYKLLLKAEELIESNNK